MKIKLSDYILKTIEELRPKMEAIYLEKGLQDPRLLELDREMENLIVTYYYAIKVEGDSKEKVLSRLYNTAIENILRLLYERNINPKDFAKSVKLTEKSLLGILSGQKKLSLTILVRIAKNLNVSVLYLMEKRK